MTEDQWIPVRGDYFDDEDPEISLLQFEQMGQLWQQGAVMQTHGLGHNRILKDKVVIKSIVEQLQI